MRDGFSEGVIDCIIYSSPDAGENRKNRGFCFLDFCDHKTASDAKRKIHAGKVSVRNVMITRESKIHWMGL